MRKKPWLAAALASTLSTPVGSQSDHAAMLLHHATAWINSTPLTADDLRGKVVLVDFWTYTCINWLRTAPYVRAWAEKYRDAGLVVVGVHTPEFEFEKAAANVRTAVAALGITYPVAVDNDYGVWRAFRNQAWPALYLVDREGRVRYHHFGEGEYETIETTVQRLLAENGGASVPDGFVEVQGRGVEAAADWRTLKSPETYLGYQRSANFVAYRPISTSSRRNYTATNRLALNRWALEGDWTSSEQAIALNEANGRIVFRFHARDLHLVMGPAAEGTAVRFRVTIDGQPPRAAHGGDIDDNGNGTVREQRLYQLIRQPDSIHERVFQIEFFDAGVEAFAFTFG